MLSLLILYKLNIKSVLIFRNLRFDFKKKLKFKVIMKEQKLNTKKRSIVSTPAAKALQIELTTAEAQVEKAWEAYKQKMAEYENALKQNAEKISLKRLLAAAKIAKFTYKIKSIEHKLAKASWKAETKVDKKAGQAASKDAVKLKAVKPANHKAPKDTATKGKSSSAETKPKGARQGKKKATAEA